MNELARDIADGLEEIENEGDHDKSPVLAEQLKRHPREFEEAVEQLRGRSPAKGGDPGPPSRPLSTSRRWTNYIGNQVVEPLGIVDARSIEDVRRAVRDAKKHRVTVKAVGSGHSSSDVVHTAGLLLSTHGMSGEIGVDTNELRDGVDPSTLCQVMAGTTIDMLNDVLWDQGRGLSNMGAYDGQTIAGAVSTATHGSGIGLPALSDIVESVLVVSGEGELLRVEPQGGITDPDKLNRPGVRLVQNDDWFHSVVVGMGCMGILCAVTLRVQPRYFLAEVRSEHRWREVREQLVRGDLFEENRHLELLINPYSTDGDHTVVMTRRNIVPEPDNPSLFRPRRQILEAIAASLPFADEAITWFLGRFPSLTPSAIDGAMELVESGDGAGGPYVDRSYRVLNLGAPNNVDAYGSEFAFGMGTYLDAVDEVFALARSAREVGGVFQTVPISLRFVRGSPHYLAMQNGDHPVCMLEVPILDGTVGAQGILERYQRRARELGGRPHWGQAHSIAGLEALGRIYPHLERWRRVRAQIDPHRVFDNTFTLRTGL